ncbi:SCF ubiquitin ligase complex subunit [Dissophora ornata]|nr:SCF ubiquitin ligase complex subunit [Dissophora ornata]
MDHFSTPSIAISESGQALDSSSAPGAISYKDLTIVGSSDSLRTSALSSCSSLSSAANAKDLERTMGEDRDMPDACSICPRDKSRLPISTTITSTAVVVNTTMLLTRRQKPNANLPSELILHVFKFLAAAHDLRSAILVCKQWCSCGIDLLWSRPSLLTSATAERMVETMAAPNTMFPYADYIRRLNLSVLATELHDSMLAQFTSCSRLERLLLAGSVNLTDAGLRRILTRCSELYSLDLSEIPAVTDALLEDIAAECPHLHTLYLGSCSAITDESVVKLAMSCPQLKRIKLSQCGLLTDRSILALTKHCPQLIEMDMTNCSLVSSEAVRSVLENLPQIRDINMALLANITNAAFASINPTIHRFEQLRVLNLTSCALITDVTLTRIIPAAPRLRSLALTKCDKITDTGASVIKLLGKHLHYLHLGHCVKITDRLVATLAQHCTRIRYLDLACCSRLTDAAVFALAQLPKLRRIGLVKCSNITDHGIYAILVSQVLAQSLERVHLSYCVHLSESAVAALVSQCSKLTHLSVTGVPAFISRKYQKFCRAPPPEFTVHQREVFCVFSGKGVRELRNYMQENPTTPSSTSLTNIRATCRRIGSSVASMVAGSESGVEGRSSESMSSPPVSTILAQMDGDLLSTSAGVVWLSDAVIAATGQNLSTLGTSASTAGTDEGGLEDMEGVVAYNGPSTSFTTVGSLVFHITTGRPSSLQDSLSLSPSEFPILQHPHHHHHHLLHSHHHREDMELDTDPQNRVPSPSTLARSLNREGEGSGAGSASPVEEEEVDNEDEDF